MEWSHTDHVNTTVTVPLFCRNKGIQQGFLKFQREHFPKSFKKSSGTEAFKGSGAWFHILIINDIF